MGDRFDATAHGVGVALASLERPRLSLIPGAARAQSSELLGAARCDVGGHRSERSQHRSTEGVALGKEPSATNKPPDGSAAPLPPPPALPRGKSCLATRLSLAAAGSNSTAGAKAVLGAAAAGGRRTSLLEVAPMMQRH